MAKTSARNGTPEQQRAYIQYVRDLWATSQLPAEWDHYRDGEDDAGEKARKRRRKWPLDRMLLQRILLHTVRTPKKKIRTARVLSSSSTSSSGTLVYRIRLSTRNGRPWAEMRKSGDSDN